MLYKYSTVTTGPRKIGYDECGNRGCPRTESAESSVGPFEKRASCKAAAYCGRGGRKAGLDGAGTSRRCGDGAERRDEIEELGKMSRTGWRMRGRIRR